MKLESFTRHPLAKPALAAATAILVGFALWARPFGEGWRLTSYDSLFRFATRPVTNQIAIVFMDNKSFEATGQARTNGWARARHATFLDRLAADGCPLVVFDVFFNQPRDEDATRALAEAMKRHSNVVLTTRQEDTLDQPDPALPGVYSMRPVPPLEVFFDAVRQTNWGVGNLEPNDDGVVRQHWRYPSPGKYDSVAWTAANLAGARLSEQPQERWIRYYAPGWAWESLSYVDAELQATNYFRDKIVFIGNKPTDTSTNAELDKFATPFTDPEHGPMVGGVEILTTEFINLVNHEWLRRPPPRLEMLALLITGAALGFGLYHRGPGVACLLGVGAAFMTLFAGVYLSYFSNYWFPWLIVAGAQVPLALAFALWHRRAVVVQAFASCYRRILNFHKHTILVPMPTLGTPDAPDYELIEPPFGKGAYGKVWLARNAVGQWQAVKAIYQANFKEDVSPYEREFRGIERYKPVSDKHPGLLRIDFVSRMKPEGYFYYAMDLGDAVTPGWEKNPTSYLPLDLAALCASNNGRISVRECVRIGIKLCEALQFLHSQGLAHRDIKPRNIIFVNGQPKLADVGLVSDARRPEQEMTLVGTPGFMPPDSEPPGTPAADIYGLGMVLYVISTGAKPVRFPELSETLVDRNLHPGFSALSGIIFKACQPDRAARYASADEMRTALLAVEAELGEVISGAQ
ncbi:MAG TPA: serine/threonine-protein kinase [Methylomirabilota bacterium]|nr:serine/threonine-protein kinase [Methylomirabilota bacterium]